MVTPPTLISPTPTETSVLPPSTVGPGGTTADLAVSLVAEPTRDGVNEVIATVTQTRPPATELLLSIDLPTGSSATWQSSRWRCESDRSSDVVCAAIGSPAPAVLSISLTYDQPATVTATVDAPENTDPNTANNVATVSIN